jgi:hypothetical protein
MLIAWLFRFRLDFMKATMSRSCFLGDPRLLVLEDRRRVERNLHVFVVHRNQALASENLVTRAYVF